MFEDIKSLLNDINNSNNQIRLNAEEYFNANKLSLMNELIDYLKSEYNSKYSHLALLLTSKIIKEFKIMNIDITSLFLTNKIYLSQNLNNSFIEIWYSLVKYMTNIDEKKLLKYEIYDLLDFLSNINLSIKSNLKIFCYCLITVFKHYDFEIYKNKCFNILEKIKNVDYESNLITTYFYLKVNQGLTISSNLAQIFLNNNSTNPFFQKIFNLTGKRIMKNDSFDSQQIFSLLNNNENQNIFTLELSVLCFIKNEHLYLNDESFNNLVHRIFLFMMSDIQLAISSHWLYPTNNEDLFNNEIEGSINYGMQFFDLIFRKALNSQFFIDLFYYSKSLAETDWRYLYTAIMILAYIIEYLEDDIAEMFLQLVIEEVKTSQNSKIIFSCFYFIGLFDKWDSINNFDELVTVFSKYLASVSLPPRIINIVLKAFINFEHKQITVELLNDIKTLMKIFWYPEIIENCISVLSACLNEDINVSFLYVMRDVVEDVSINNNNPGIYTKIMEFYKIFVNNFNIDENSVLNKITDLTSIENYSQFFDEKSCLVEVLNTCNILNEKDLLHENLLNNVYKIIHSVTINFEVGEESFELHQLSIRLLNDLCIKLQRIEEFEINLYNSYINKAKNNNLACVISEGLLNIAKNCTPNMLHNINEIDLNKILENNTNFEIIKNLIDLAEIFKKHKIKHNIIHNADFIVEFYKTNFSNSLMYLYKFTKNIVKRFSDKFVINIMNLVTSNASVNENDKTYKLKLISYLIPSTIENIKFQDLLEQTFTLHSELPYSYSHLKNIFKCASSYIEFIIKLKAEKSKEGFIETIKNDKILTKVFHFVTLYFNINYNQVDGTVDEFMLSQDYYAKLLGDILELLTFDNFLIGGKDYYSNIFKNWFGLLPFNIDKHKSQYKLLNLVLTDEVGNLYKPVELLQGSDLLIFKLNNLKI
jgi:hypothetical protein